LFRTNTASSNVIRSCEALTPAVGILLSRLEKFIIYNLPEYIMLHVTITKNILCISVYNQWFIISVYNQWFIISVYNQWFIISVYNQWFIISIYNQWFIIENWEIPSWKQNLKLNVKATKLLCPPDIDKICVWPARHILSNRYCKGKGDHIL
jgi:hypothetical protein